MEEKVSKISDKSLFAVDPLAFNGGKSPYPPADKSLENGWASGVAFFQDTIANRVGFTGGRVLDLLCGHGRWSLFLSEANEYLFGVDRLQGAINIASDLCSHFNVGPFDFRCDSFEYIGKMESDSFDYVWLYGALQYINRDFTLRNATRLLRPGGRIFISNYNSSGLMLQHVIRGAENNQINAGGSQWALNALQRGEHAHGTPSYSTIEGSKKVAEDFGLNLVCAAADRRLDIRDERVFQHHDDVPTHYGNNLLTVEYLLEKPEAFTTCANFLKGKLSGDQVQVNDWIRRLSSAERPPIEDLIAIALESDKSFSNNARHALVRIGKPSVTPLLKRMPSVKASARIKLTQTMTEIGADALGPILSAYASTSARDLRKELKRAIEVIDLPVAQQLA